MRRATLSLLCALVAARAHAAPDGRYAVTDATVRDQVTGLIWERTPALCNDPDPLSGEIGCEHAAAQSYCDLLVLAGRSDWRLPTKYELASLWDYDERDFIAAPFGGRRPATYWSSTLWRFPVQGVTLPLAVDTFYGSADALRPATRGQVRCVRGPAED